MYKWPENYPEFSCKVVRNGYVHYKRVVFMEEDGEAFIEYKHGLYIVWKIEDGSPIEISSYTSFHEAAVAARYLMRVN